jgi:hypothetical protein
LENSRSIDHGSGPRRWVRSKPVISNHILAREEDPRSQIRVCAETIRNGPNQNIFTLIFLDHLQSLLEDASPTVFMRTRVCKHLERKSFLHCENVFEGDALIAKFVVRKI